MREMKIMPKINKKRVKRYAKQTALWLRRLPHYTDATDRKIFEYASGWSNRSWEHVLNEDLNDPTSRKYIFYTLLYLKKKAEKSA